MSDTASAKATDGEIVAEKKDEKKQGTSDASFNMDELEALAALVNEHGFTDFEFENENIRVRLSKQATASVMAPAPAQATARAQTPTASPAADATAEAAVDTDADLHKIVSPIVGTFYRASGPNKDS